MARIVNAITTGVRQAPRIDGAVCPSTIRCPCGSPTYNRLRRRPLLGPIVRILIVSQYFWPECFILNELARKLAEAGNAVVVATGKPNYPSGKIAPGYAKNGVQRETYAGGIEIIRIPSRPRGKTSAFNLSLNYLSFMLSGLTRLPWLLQGRRSRLQFPPFFCATSSTPISRYGFKTYGRMQLFLRALSETGSLSMLLA